MQNAKSDIEKRDIKSELFNLPYDLSKCSRFEFVNHILKDVFDFNLDLSLKYDQNIEKYLLGFTKVECYRSKHLKI